MTKYLFGLWIVLSCAGCIGNKKQQNNKGIQSIEETDIVLDTTGSISVGEEFFIYE